ncbi:MAG: crossover junction endodeoxyribonuclease RuvC [Chloroflexota bacterium]|nr:crossover junction endodeoxyribonuclease RuvC [Chloroflexota bacterium]
MLGIDPGTTGMGYAILDAARDPAALRECGMVPTPRGGTAGERLLAIADGLDALIGVHAPVALALERLYFNRNVRTAMSVAEARGVALLAAARVHMAVVEYTPQEVKLAVTGVGGADKRAVQRMVHILVGQEIAEDNVADAVAIALTHAYRARFERAVAAASSGDPGVDPS